MSIDVPNKGDVIFIKLAGANQGHNCQVIDWNLEHGEQSWAVLNDGVNKFQINMSQIATYSVIEKYAAPPKEFIIKRKNEKDNIKVGTTSGDTVRRYKIARPVEPDADPSPELQGVTDPTLRAMKLAELRKKQQKLKMSNIKDHMTVSDTKGTEHNYEMPSFKKRTGK